MTASRRVEHRTDRYRYHQGILMDEQERIYEPGQDFTKLPGDGGGAYTFHRGPFTVRSLENVWLENDDESKSIRNEWTRYEYFNAKCREGHQRHLDNMIKREEREERYYAQHGYYPD